jgi:hypothetical protein
MATLDGSATQGNAALISYMLANTDPAQVDSFSEVRDEFVDVRADIATLSGAEEVHEITTSQSVLAYSVPGIPTQDSSGDYRLRASYNGIRLGSSDYSLSFGSGLTTITLSLPYAVEAGESLIIELNKS